MSNAFSKLMQVSIPAPKRSNFDLSHPTKDTLSPGFLYPLLVEDVIPGDEINLSIESRLKTQPTIAPILGKFDLTFFTFFCPWRNYIPEMNFNNKQVKFEDEFTIPSLKFSKSTTLSRVGASSLLEYLGFPKGYTSLSDAPSDYQGNPAYNAKFNGIPLLCYWDIWRNYFANPQSDEVYTCIGRRFDSSTRDDQFKNLDIRFFDKLFDYMRSYPTQGIVESADYLLANYTSVFGSAKPFDSLIHYLLDYGDAQAYTPEVFNTLDAYASHAGLLPVMYKDDMFTARLSNSYVDYVRQQVVVDTSSGSFSIDQLRLSNKLAKYVDKSLLGGTRYGQWLKTHFAVDGMEHLDIPILIGMDRMDLFFDDVVSQAQTGEGNNQDLGSVGGRASVHYPSTKNIDFFAKEHGTLMTVACLRPTVDYFQGIPKRLLKTQFSDIYVPELDAVGWQPILAKELYANTMDVQRIGANGGVTAVTDGSWLNPDDIVGYSPAWIEYMTRQGIVRGMFTTTLDYWTLQRKFAYRDVDGDLVIDLSTYVNPDLFNYAFAGTDDNFDNFYLNTWWSLYMRRNISKQILPSL